MAPRRQEPVFVAKSTFACELDGHSQMIHEGERVHGGHELLDRYPENFEAVGATSRFAAAPEVEQATAAPGEKRG